MYICYGKFWKGQKVDRQKNTFSSDHCFSCLIFSHFLFFLYKVLKILHTCDHMLYHILYLFISLSIVWGVYLWRLWNTLFWCFIYYILFTQMTASLPNLNSSTLDITEGVVWLKLLFKSWKAVLSMLSGCLRSRRFEYYQEADILISFQR